MSNIYTAINKVMEEVGAVAKSSTSDKYKYKYRGIDAVMNALHPAMTKNGVFCVPELIEQTREERETSNGGTLIYSICKVKYTYYAPDGSNVVSVVIGEGMDSGDKATNKAMSAAFKYACFQIFCIPTEEMKDSEEDSPEPSTKRNGVQRTQKKSEPNSPGGNVSEQQIEELKSLCAKLNFTYEKFLKSNHASEETLTSDQAEQWIDGLKKHIKAKSKESAN